MPIIFHEKLNIVLIKYHANIKKDIIQMTTPYIKELLCLHSNWYSNKTIETANFYTTKNRQQSFLSYNNFNKKN